MSDKKPVIWWVRRDLRLTDNSTLKAVLETGAPVIPVFILDEVFDAYGACPRWRFGLGAMEFARTLQALGSRLIFRRGKASDVLRDVIAETGAATVRWTRAYDPDQVARDKSVKTDLSNNGIDAASCAGHLLFEPWDVQTGQGGFYQVFTPFWKSVKTRDVAPPLAQLTKIPSPDTWPESDDPDDWNLSGSMSRGAHVVRPHLTVGENAAQSKLDLFIDERVQDYVAARDIPAVEGTSRLSENLAWGEISPRQCWHAGIRARQEGKSGADTFLKELVWREFAYHLVWHTPHITQSNWRRKWDAFAWNEDAARSEVLAWKQGRTGIQFVDAAMRQMYVTGYMHNRARMIVASYLTKHLLTHWRIGLNWFEDCLVDWDPASNALGWQWSAGSGPDATPYFRVFNPVTQLDKFDKDRRYASTWIAEGLSDAAPEALSFFDAIPKSWGLSVDSRYPQAVVTAEDGRKRALDAYQNRDF